MGSGPVRDDREREGRGVMAEGTAHHEVAADHDRACEARRHQSPRCACRCDKARKRRSQRRGSCAVPELVQGTCGWTRSKRRTPDFEIVRERNHNDGIDFGYLEDRVTLGEHEAGPSPILVARSSTTQVTTADVLPCKGTTYPWCVQALVRATVATGDAKIILRSDNEPAILDLKRQAAAA